MGAPEVVFLARPPLHRLVSRRDGVTVYAAKELIATDVAGHAEIVDDGSTDFLADALTAHSMASALERFWARRHEAEERGKAGARKIRAIMPFDPVRLFSDQLSKLAGL